MHVEKKRIFVGNLPPYISENEIKNHFTSYGNVVSVDIKKRKVNTEENVSPVFAFVNIEIDNRTLQKCFEELGKQNWQGYYVNLQLAKESFLDRLKREREEAQGAQNVPNNISNSKVENLPSTTIIHTKRNEKYHSSSSESDDEPKQNGVEKNGNNYTTDSDKSDEEETKSQQKVKSTRIDPIEKNCNNISDSSDGESEVDEKKKISPEIEDNDIKLVIKSNKHKVIDTGGLKIESVNSTPIHIITKKGVMNEKKDKKAMAADEKRIESLKKMKSSYNNQKNIIQKALSRIDTTQNSQKRNVQETTTPRQETKRQKLSLFDDEEDNDNINFEVKNQFEGKKGQKLLELQSHYTNDKRFTLDERFADDGDENELEAPADDEREKQFEILESVLGEKVRKKDFKDDSKKDNTTRGMLRFDPSKPEHSKFEIKREENQKKDKRKKENKEQEKVENTTVPEVSKDKFYQVKDNLKESLKEKEGFSLLSMFGREEEKDDDKPEPMEELRKNKFDNNKNPFKYDSSDSEDEQKTKTKKISEKIEPQPALRWAEPFFFEIDDNRLKDGFDFLKNMNKQNNSESFKEKRRTLQRIIHGKVKHVERDKRKFHKQLRKRIKVKKAQKSNYVNKY